jgi:hypothetical protein
MGQLSTEASSGIPPGSKSVRPRSSSASASWKRPRSRQAAPQQFFHAFGHLRLAEPRGAGLGACRPGL